MLRFFKKGSRVLLAGILPADPSGPDIVSKDTKTYKAYLARAETTNETGLDRLKEMFKTDDYGHISSELSSIYQAGFMGLLVGVIYGGIIQSRTSYMNFMENNEATAFKSHLDAKRKLQNNFTVNFAKGGFKWGWRIGLFTTSYYGIITCVSLYREKSSIYEYLAAGSITGAAYKINMGLRGMAAGGIVGFVFGGIAGSLSLLLLYASGTTMKDMRYWHSKWRVNRDEQVHKATKKLIEEQYETPAVIKEHDAKVGNVISLDSIK